MSSPVISIENISKSYQLGVIGTGTFRGDVQRWWATLRGLPDPFLEIDAKDHGNRDGETVWALKDVSFKVQQGEAVGIIGRNGAGKSTLLKILSRVTAPTSGEVKVKGRISSLLEVGTGFHPELTGRENIFLNGAILGMNRHEIERKFDEIVDFSGVEKYIDTPVKRYSSGMYVRLAFAVAAHLEPDILIVDEVLAVGDAEFQKKCLGKMGEVTYGGRTVLLVSHNMGSIRSLCERAILLNSGRIQGQGITEGVVQTYMAGQTHGLVNENVSVDAHLRFPTDFEVVKVEFVNSRGQITKSLMVNETYECRIYYKIHVEGKYKFSVNFRSNDDILLGVASTLSTDMDIEGEIDALYFMSFHSKMRFMPGLYTISIVVKEKTRGHLDTVSGIEFSVENVATNNDKLFGLGYVHVGAEWTQPVKLS